MSPARNDASPAVVARLIHLSLVVGVLLFLVVAWRLGTGLSQPSEALPDRRVLYIALFVVSASLFAAAGWSARRLVRGSATQRPDDWWRRNLGRVVVIWALVELPALLGIVAFLLTRDFRTLLATLTGLLLFFHHSPRRLIEGA